MKETWKAFGDGTYEVSSEGRVRRVTTKRPRKTELTKKGYVRLSIVRDGIKRNYKMHALVAHAFLGPRPQGLHVNHKDGCKANNALLNLEYITHVENMAHAKANGLTCKGKPSSRRGIKRGASVAL